MEKEEIEKIPHNQIEVDVKKIKKFENQFRHREIIEIKYAFEWYHFNFTTDLVNCETKVFVSIAERKGGCATAEDARFNVFNVVPTNGRISLIIYKGNVSGEQRTAQIDFLGFTAG